MKLHIFAKKHRKIIFLIIILIYLYFILGSIDKVLLIDEVMFMEAAKSILETGKPYFYQGEQPWASTPFHPLAFDKMYLLLFHPTLYLHILSLSVEIFGAHSFSLRMFGVLSSLIIIFLIYFIAIEIFKHNEKSMQLHS